MPPDRRDAALEVIERNARAQAKLIEDLLDVSRIISGKLVLDVAEVDLQQVLMAAVEVVRPAAEAKQITLNIEIDPERTLTMGDPARLQQAVWNLLSNAVKFALHRGSVGVALKRAGDLARISVTDDGIGIPFDFLPHVFERFRQADGSTTRVHGGLGLGLAIVRHIVELHGGSVSATSDGKDCGATFTIDLPIFIPPSWRTGDFKQRTTAEQP
jgi:signal transduction histidine kinase